MSIRNYHHKRHQARVYALQALYQWYFNPLPAEQLVEQLKQEIQQSTAQVELDYFETLVLGVILHVEEIDKQLKTCIDRSITALGAVELSVLRLGIYELQYTLEVPDKVIINEALKLTKAFGAADAYKYVNAVLDRLRPQLRPVNSD